MTTWLGSFLFPHNCLSCNFLFCPGFSYDVYEHGRIGRDDYALCIRYGRDGAGERSMHIPMRLLLEDGRFVDTTEAKDVRAALIHAYDGPELVDAIAESRRFLGMLNEVRARHLGWDQISAAAAQAEDAIDRAKG